MIDNLWRDLSKASTKLLNMSIGPDHGDYERLKCSLAAPPSPVKFSIKAAMFLWVGLREWTMERVYTNVVGLVSGLARDRERFGAAPDSAMSTTRDTIALAYGHVTFRRF